MYSPLYNKLANGFNQILLSITFPLESINKSVVTEKTGAGGDQAVGINEPTCVGIIIPTLEIVEPEVGAIVITSVSQAVVGCCGIRSAVEITLLLAKITEIGI